MTFRFITKSLLYLSCLGFPNHRRSWSHLNPSQLKNYLHEQLSINHTSIGYKQARKLLLDYDQIDIYQPGDHSECFFSGICHLPYSDHNKKTHKFNIEHVYPQSKSSKKKKVKSDLHNIFVCDALINQHRSNYRFADYDYYQDQTNKLVFLDSSGNEMVPFEENIENLCAKDTRKLIFIPPALSRGIISRSLAYNCLRYDLKPEKVIIDIDLIRKWNRQFPPRQTEKIRNFWIHHFQGNRNIFIDHPELIDLIFF